MANPDSGVKFQDDVKEQSIDQAYNQAVALANKYKDEFSKIGQETATYEQNYWNENKDELQKQGWSYTPDKNSAYGGKWSKSSTSVSTPAVVKPALVSKVDWNAKATQYGFKDTDAVKQWQKKNGLVADGMFGAKSIAKYNELERIKQQKAEAERIKLEAAKKMRTTVPLTQTIKPAEAPKNVTFDWNNFVSDKGLKYETIDGKKYALYDPWGTGEFRIDENGHIYDHRSGMGWVKATDDNLNITPKTSAYYDYDNYKDLMNMMTRYIQGRKQGGIMQINKFQQGGSMSAQQVLQQLAQGIQNQNPQAIQILQDLATKAANGDEKSVQFLTGVQSLAEKGDQAATIIMDAISRMASSQQTPSAKWGSKLKYIRSLKYAKGGKACPACQAGASIPTSQDKAYTKATKKVEEKACGGKAKKRYFGGWL